jgi:arginase family enzyme
VGAPDRHPQRRPGEKRFVHEAGLEVFDMRYIDEMGMRHTMELALATLDANTHLHVSFDVDFLDPEIAPGVGTTVPGGPDLPRGAAVHGDDRRHRPPGQPGRDGAEPGAGRAQQDRRCWRST